MSKAALITGLFVAILFLYIFVMLRQTMHSVSKIEAFSSSAGSAGSSSSAGSAGSGSEANNSDTVSEASADTVGGSRKMEKVDVPVKKKDMTETFAYDPDPGASLVGTNTRNLKSLLVDDDGQRALARDIARDEDAIIPRHTLGITAPEGIPFPAKNDVIGNEDQRIYWIANVLYELNPDNGMAQFIEEVRGLASLHRNDTFAEIIAKLKEYTKEKAKASNQSNTINELMHITKELSHKVQSLPNSLITSVGNYNPTTIPAPLEPAVDGIEMFVDPSSYVRAYSAFSSSSPSASAT